MADNNEMTTASLAITPLGSEPRVNLETFRDSATVFAGTKCTAHHPDGLNIYHPTKTNREYDALKLVQKDEHGQPVLDEHEHTIPLPRKAYPGKPERPHGANAAVLHFYKEDMIHANEVAVGITALRTAVLIAAGPIINAELSAEPGGIAAKSLAEILQHIDTHYGILAAEDIKKLRFRISDYVFRSPANFTEDAANFHLLVATLAKGGEAMTQTNLMEIFTENTKGMVGFPEIIARYKRKVKNLVDRNVKDLTDQVRLEMSVITTSGMQYANNCGTDNAEDDMINQVLAMSNAAAQSNAAHFADALKKIGDRIDTMESRGQSGSNPDRGGGKRNTRGDRGGRGTGGRGGTGRGSGPGTTETRASHYCFEHGKNRTHAGTDCKVMQHDKSYTDAMKSATGPCTLSGWEGAK